MCIKRCDGEETPVSSSEQTAKAHVAYHVCTDGTPFIAGKGVFCCFGPFIFPIANTNPDLFVFTQVFRSHIVSEEFLAQTGLLLVRIW